MDNKDLITIYIDGQPVETVCCRRNGCLMVPSLFLKHACVKVDWNSDKELIIFRKDGMTLKLIINGNYALYYSSEKDSWEKELLQTIIIDNYIPLKYTAEKLGMNIYYEASIDRFYLITNFPKLNKPKVILKGNSNKKMVSLTFDDGPDNYATPRILDILKDKGVKATFCVIGSQVEYFPEILERISKEGHEICNHSWNHPKSTEIKTCQVIREIKKCEEIIQSVTGLKTNFFRPPYGCITDADLSLINKLGIKTIAWNVDTLDYRGLSEEEIIKIVSRDISPGSIILQHSSQWKLGMLDGTIKALPKIIDLLNSLGLEPITVSRLLEDEDAKLG